MKTSTKLILAFILISLLNITPALIKMNFTGEFHKHLSLILESNLAEHESISQLAYYLQRTKSNIRELLLELNSRPKESEVAHAKEVVQRSLMALEKHNDVLSNAVLRGKELGAYNDRQDTDIEIEQAKAIAANIDKFIKGAHEILTVADHTDDVKYYLALFVNNVEPLSRTLQDQIEEFKNEEFKEVRQELEEMAEDSRQLKNYVNLMSAAGFILTIIIGTIVAVRFTKECRK